VVDGRAGRTFTGFKPVLNLRRSGFCTLGRLSGAHPRRTPTASPSTRGSGWLGSSTKLSYRPT